MFTIEKLRRDKNLAKYQMELDMLARQVEDLTAGFSADAAIASTLSFTELRIASLIKPGFNLRITSNGILFSILIDLVMSRPQSPPPLILPWAGMTSINRIPAKDARAHNSPAR